jgi:tetratricopeptide (TPR) repeat protein
VLEIKPDEHEAWYNLGNAFRHLKKYEEAISAYKKALEIKPDKHEAWNNLGNAYGDLKKYEEAISAYKKVLEIKPDEHKAWYNLGNAFRRLQKFEDAIGAYKKALEIKPDKHEAWYNLGNAYGDLQKYEDAIEAYAKAIQINPEDPDVWMNLCAAHLGFFGEDTLAKGGEFDPMKLRQALECLPHIKEKKGIYEIFGSILRFLLEEKKLERIRGILTEIERIGHGDLLQFLTPYSTLLKYIDTKDPQVIERLRSEERTIVEEMLQTLEKGRPAENK